MANNGFVGRKDGPVHLHNWGEMEVFRCEGLSEDILPRYFDLYHELEIESLLKVTKDKSGMLQTLFNV